MAKGWEYDLANALKDRDNPRVLGPCIGVVTSVSPFQASIQGGTYLLTSSNTHICRSAIRDTYGMTSSGSLSFGGTSGTYSASGSVTLANRFSVGDEVLVLPDKSGQHFFVVDVIGGAP